MKLSDAQTGRRGAGAAAALALVAVSGAARGELSIVGVGDTIASNVRAHVGLAGEPCDAPQWRVERAYQSAPAEIREALEAFGYYEAEFTTELEQGEECWSATIDISAGEPVRVRMLDLQLRGEAMSDPEFTALFGSPGLTVGNALRHGAYEQFKRDARSLARNRGYPNARIETARIDVYPSERAADVHVRFDSGPRYAFGAVVLEQDVLSERLVRAYLSFEQGEPYDAAALTSSYVNLNDSGYFSTIDMRPQEPNHDERTIGVRVALTGAPRRLISYGVGFSTDTGPRLRFGRNNRRFNERGHQFGVDAQLSPVTSEVLVNYRFPYGDPRTEWVSYDGGIRREKTDTSESESLELGARRVVERPGPWTRTQFVELVVEDFEVSDQSGRTRLLMPGIEWTRLQADSSIRPRNGSRVAFEVRGAGDRLGSSTSFVQAVIEGKWITSLDNDARILIRGRLGLTAEDVFEDLPASVRFFAGGDNSVRGYKFESLGPTNEAGEVVGGSGLLTGSFEYEHPVRNRWSVAFFVDSGNAFRGSDFDAKTGVGVGARWQSPLGPIRIDVAAPLDDPDRSARLHVSLGPDL